MKRLESTVIAATVLLASAAPGVAAAQDCIPCELADLLEGEYEICPDEPSCPCFTADDIDTALAGLDPYMYSWAERPWDQIDHTSLRADAWECTPDGWIAPTVGFDTYIETDECGVIERYMCASWDDTWRAAPHHSWAGTGNALTLEITADEFAECEALLYDWAADAGAPSWSW
jgi:hypothetical protein